MSINNIPFDLEVEILKRVLPVKSLIRFRSVSKQWKSLIDSSRFIMDHSLNQTQPHLMLVSYGEDKYVSIVDEDSFPRNKFSHILPPNIRSFPGHAVMLDCLMLDCSHGLVCFYCFHARNRNRKDVVVLWNPSIRKSVEVVLPQGSKVKVFGVGECPANIDPKIVKVFAHRKAKVFTLSTGEWRCIKMNLRWSLKSFRFQYNQVVIDGVIHWLAYDLDSTNAVIISVIISFDLTTEEFGEVVLPDSLSPPRYRTIYKLKGSLALISEDEHNLCDLWMMIKNGDPKFPFTKLFTIDLETLYI